MKYYYVDDSFNGVDWDAAYKAALDQTYEAQSGDEVDAITTQLLKRLDDPFTRLLSPQASKNYKAEKQGTVREASAACLPVTADDDRPGANIGAWLNARLQPQQTACALQFRSFGIGADCSSAAQAGACVLDYVQSGSAAAEAGLRTGTQVVAFQQQPINEATARRDTPRLRKSDPLLQALGSAHTHMPHLCQEGIRAEISRKPCNSATGTTSSSLCGATCPRHPFRRRMMQSLLSPTRRLQTHPQPQSPYSSEQWYVSLLRYQVLLQSRSISRRLCAAWQDAGVDAQPGCAACRMWTLCSSRPCPRLPARMWRTCD